MSTKTVVRLLVALALTFGFLGIFGAYQNEKKKALFRATQAVERAALEQRMGEEDRVKLDCSTAWTKYHKAEADVEYAGITEGRSAAVDAEVEASKLKPICDYDLRLDAFMKVEQDWLDHASAVEFLEALATAERQYAVDRKLQTRCIRHKVWAKLTGIAPETDAEWVLFLAQNYGGKLGGLALGKKGASKLGR